MATIAGSTINGQKIVGAMISDVGCERSHNEDTVVYVNPGEREASVGHGFLALVADGMGGHAAGEVASALAADEFRRIYFSRPVDESLCVSLEHAIWGAHRAVIAAADKKQELRGMGTTCTALAVRDCELWLAHVGDSRAYLRRENHLMQISNDHTLLARMVKDGLLTPEEALYDSRRNVIVQALGAKGDFEPDIWETGLPLQDGDVFLLCSDGLNDMVDDDSIERVMTRVSEGEIDAEEGCRQLVALAISAGGADNISVGVFLMDGQNRWAPTDLSATRSIPIPTLDDLEPASQGEHDAPLDGDEHGAS
jgi:serine/threonine protein phosphatase PrpC